MHNIPIRVTDRDESEWMVVDGDRVITNIFSPRGRSDERMMLRLSNGEGS